MLLKSAPDPHRILKIERMRLREVIVWIAQVCFGRTIDEPASAITLWELLLAELVAFQREGGAAVSKAALAKQAHGAARKRAPAERSAASRKAARTRAANR